MSLSGGKKRPTSSISSSKLRNLAKMISWLDGYAALSCGDPMKLERLAKSESDSIEEVGKVWNEVRRDVKEIAMLPSASDDIVRTSKYLNVARIAITLMGVGVILVFLLLSSFIPALRNSSVRIAVLIVVASLYYVVFFSYFLLGRRLNRLVAAYFEKHQGEVSKERRHAKAATQRLIDILAMKIRASPEENPENYKFKLLNDDYSNVRILQRNEKRPDEVVAVVKGRMTPDNK